VEFSLPLAGRPYLSLPLVGRAGEGVADSLNVKLSLPLAGRPYLSLPLVGRAGEGVAKNQARFVAQVCGHGRAHSRSEL
jgi:hypothetical protein